MFRRYKSHILIFSGLFILSFGVNGQNFKGGILAGFNATQINGDDMAGFNKYGLWFGPFTSYPLKSNWILEAELLFTQKGSRKNFSPDNPNPGGKWEKVNLNYIEMPLLARYPVNEKIQLHGGLGLAYLLSSRASTFSAPYQAEFRTYEFNILGGGSYRLSDHFTFIARYQNSLTNIGTCPSRPFWRRYNTGFLNIVVTFGLRYNIGEANH